MYFERSKDEITQCCKIDYFIAIYLPILLYYQDLRKLIENLICPDYGYYSSDFSI